MKKHLKFLFLLTFFQETSAYQLADISFVLADTDLLKEIGVIASDKGPVEEKAKLKEKIELVISLLENEKELTKIPVKMIFDKEKKQIVACALPIVAVCSDFFYPIVSLEDDEAFQMVVFIDSYLSNDLKEKEYGRVVLKNSIELQDEDAFDVATLTKKLQTLN